MCLREYILSSNFTVPVGEEGDVLTLLSCFKQNYLGSKFLSCSLQVHGVS